MRKGIGLTFVVGSLLALIATPVSAQSLQAVPFGGQAYSSPYHLTGAPGDSSRVFVVESAGIIRLVVDGVTQGAPFLDISAEVWDAGEGGCECGLFSIAPAPDYASSGRFYVFYTRDVSPGFHYLRIQEFRRSANPNVADPVSGRIVLEIPHLGADNHNGGQLQFGPDGLLYIWVGDGGNPSSNAQSLSTPLGKLLRIDPRGAAPYAIPGDNPFADGAGPNSDEIYSLGLRNPWRGSFDRSTGDLTIGDVGAGAWEEIDFKPEGEGRGANFGWNCFEGFAVNTGCPVPNHSPPVHVYPNSGTGTAIAGGFVIRDSALPSWKARYIYTDSYDPDLRTLDPKLGSSTDASLGLPGFAFPVSFGQDACGHIYVVDNGTGIISRLEPVGAPFPCKLAPELTVETKSARRAAQKGAVVVGVRCDEDCDLVGDAVIAIKRGGGNKASAAKPARLRAKKATGTLELENAGTLKLDLSRKQTRRLRKALSRGRRATARIEVSATGGGGGTDTVKKKVRQRTKKRKRGR